MTTIDANLMLESATEAEVEKNMNMSALIYQAGKLPYCKRNIISAMILFWGKTYHDIMEILCREDMDNRRKLNPSAAIEKYLIKNKLGQPEFVKFFFSFYNVLVEAFMKKLLRELSNGMPREKKFCYLANEITELINIALIELRGMDFACTSFGGEPICPKYITCGKHDCRESGGVFHFYMTEEFTISPEIYPAILDTTLQFIRRSNRQIILICDYRNIHQPYIGRPAFERTTICLKYFPAVYFYHIKPENVDEKVRKDILPWLIPDKDSLKRVKDEWKYSREIVRFT